MVKRQDFKPAQVKSVEAMAFVMPLWDLNSPEDFVPCQGSVSVGYRVYGWSREVQRWGIVLDFTECGYEARRIARQHHRKVCDELGVKP